MGTITAQFQGILTIPLYKTPYTFTVPNYLSASQGASINGYSDTPIVNEAYSIQQQTTNIYGFQEYTSGSGNALRYKNINTFGVNGGYNTALTLKRNMLTCYYGGVLTYGTPYNEWTTPNGPPYNRYASIMQIPFYTDITTQNVLQPAIDTVGNNNYWAPNQSIPMLTAYGGAFTCFPSVIGGPGLAFSNALQVYFRSFSFLLGNGVPQLVSIIPGAMFVSLTDPSRRFAMPLTGTTISNFNDIASMPDLANGQNYLIGFGTNNIITRVLWSLPDYVTGLMFTQIDNIVFDGNSNLNAQLSKYNAYTVCKAIGVRGFLATDIDGKIDYFVSKDGSKYWQLGYSPQGNAAMPTIPSVAESQFKFVDNNGVFWYTGVATQSGQIVQPLYSLGFNLPYGFFSLNFPPFALPCYDTCLGTDWPLTKIQRMK